MTAAPKLKRLMDIDELCELWGVKRSWVQQRTGPRSTRYPKIPTVPGFKPLKFDPEEIARVPLTAQNASSLKTKKVGNSGAQKPERRVLESLW
ncbi:hypothetical protein [Bdellovibrio bacteriovorus]|uniref:hypothetical protein n=1 Tax=Bdellovibrio bacteriovorus TaxID=959 RepID=UPI003AA9915B